MADSEVARILQKIREEEEAAQRGLHEYAIVSRHQFITTHMDNMSRCVKELAEVTGSEEVAIALVVSDQIQRENASTHVTSQEQPA
jgi:hypothetical protein